MSLKEDINNIPALTKMKVSTRMRVAAKIMDLLGEKGWSKSEFAAKVGKQPSEISKWLSGTHNFTIETLCEIATTFNVNLHEMLNFKNTKGGDDEA